MWSYKKLCDDKIDKLLDEIPCLPDKKKLYKTLKPDDTFENYDKINVCVYIIIL